MNAPEMGDSGETMMGIDRKHGGQLNTTEPMIEFWKLIDNSSKDQWRRGYMGGPLEGRLRTLVAEAMKLQFAKYSQKYLSPESREIVYSNPKILFHFVYATWNGPGWFKRFASEFNDAVKSGVNDTDKLARFAIMSRVDSGNPIIRNSGNKISQILAV
jgi:hypothetical protein